PPRGARLSPYTTLFRSEGADGVDAAVEVVQRGRPQFRDGVEVLHRHALVGVVAAEAVEDEVVEIKSIVGDNQAFRFRRDLIDEEDRKSTRLNSSHVQSS